MWINTYKNSPWYKSLLKEIHFLYIVDVNNTPFSPDHRSRTHVREAIERSRRAFLREFAAGEREPEPQLQSRGGG